MVSQPGPTNQALPPEDKEPQAGQKHREGRSREGIRMQAGLPPPTSKKRELRSGTVKGKNYSPSFPSSGAAGANQPQYWHRRCCHGDSVAFSTCCPRQVSPSPRLRAGRTWQYILPGLKSNQRSKWRITCSTVAAHNQYHATIYFSFYFTVQLLCKSSGVLRWLTVKIHMMHLH